MISTLDLLSNGLLEHPFLHYPDTRFFYPLISEQRRVLEVASGFIQDQKDPSKNLGVIAGAVGSGKSMLAMKAASTRYLTNARSSVLGLYMNTNTVTEPRHFLMAVIETLGLPSARSNANRIESIFDYLDEHNDELLLVLDGPPVDQEYLTQLLSWSVEHTKKIRTIIFLQDLNNTTSNIGGLNQFLGLYVPFRAPGVQEIASLLYARLKMAGSADPLSLLPEQVALNIADQARGSLTNALALASAYLEEQIEVKKNRLFIPEIGPRSF
ncbi:MAG TPA: ATP-binding protein [Anaerolineaceae bacterium]|jgi:Cdc6-like AAA superfamily ATPase|nr:ATP-binding protein [Anaerolineaceae bacterium]HOE34180.1 ATP-binding protein [Anaerolineaceae bacterium]HOT25177.1 ATP-binding protein [Anaerolineaceae bacterium]HQH57732.1 ATP-binding protein [Anaerolineaceae bacterium]HQK02762.1 ATP-binding protein [Anaerolineaceae bacterium]